jgi:hypothetical protein
MYRLKKSMELLTALQELFNKYLENKIQNFEKFQINYEIIIKKLKDVISILSNRTDSKLCLPN